MPCKTEDLEIVNESGEVLLVTPGWHVTEANDGNFIFYDMEDVESACHEYIDTGDWGDDPSGFFNMYVKKLAYSIDTGNTTWYNTHSLVIVKDQDEPECELTEHDWQSPYSVLGGLKENPGVFGNGGGVIIKEVCKNCGVYKITDTWAQNPYDGSQGYTTVEYEPADDDSLEWIESLT